MSIKPALFDVVELLTDLPTQQLRIGDRGAIVESYNDNTFEVEFTNREGETLALVALPAQQFMVVWSADTCTWVSETEQVATLLSRLPKELNQEVLNFVRFLYARGQLFQTSLDSIKI
jgi:hypothetical protein